MLVFIFISICNSKLRRRSSRQVLNSEKFVLNGYHCISDLTLIE